MKEINYSLEIDTDADERKMDNWHNNILKFGTITNTIKQTCDLTGTISKI